jgi:hypothetical protein
MSGRARLADLLETARETLRRELVPDLAPKLRYRAAMIANAMAIAGRALAVGEDSEARQRAALAGVLEAPPTVPLETLRRQVARELRRGRVAPEREPALRAALRAYALARLEISAPDYPDTFPPSGAADDSGSRSAG